MFRLSAAYDGDRQNPEIQISGSSDSLVSFGDTLKSIKEGISFDIELNENAFYPVRINRICIFLQLEGSNRLAFVLDENNVLTIRGTNCAMKKIGQSLINYFGDGAGIGEHFQLDYYDGNEILDETNCSLIFMCDR